MLTANQYIQHTSTATQIMRGSILVYKGIKGILNAVITIPIILIAIPFIWGVLRYLRFKIKSSGKFSLSNPTTKEYKNFRLDYDQMSDIVEKLEEVPNFKTTDVPFLFRGVVKEMLLIKSDIIACHQNMKDELLKFTNKSSKSDGYLFKEVSEGALWDARNKAYDYLV